MKITILMIMSLLKVLAIVFVIAAIYLKHKQSHEAEIESNNLDMCDENGAASDSPILLPRKENGMNEECKNNNYERCLKSVNTLIYEVYGVCSWRWISSHPLIDIQEQKQCLATVIPFGEGARKITVIFSDELIAQRLFYTDHGNEHVSEDTVTTPDISESDTVADKIAINFVSDNLSAINEACQEAISKGETSFIISPDDKRPSILNAIAKVLTNSWHNYKSAVVLNNGTICASVDLASDVLTNNEPFDFDEVQSGSPEPQDAIEGSPEEEPPSDAWVEASDFLDGFIPAAIPSLWDDSLEEQITALEKEIQGQESCCQAYIQEINHCEFEERKESIAKELEACNNKISSLKEKLSELNTKKSQNTLNYQYSMDGPAITGDDIDIKSLPDPIPDTIYKPA